MLQDNVNHTTDKGINTKPTILYTEKMKPLFLLSIVAILLIAGCTNVPDLGLNTNSIASGQGLEMTSFTAQPATVYSGSNVRLTMEVQNLGGTEVTNDQGIIFLTGTNSGSWGGLTQFTSFGTTMKTEDIVRSVPANILRKSWSLTAPTSIGAGQIETDTIIARVYSNYQTKVNGNIWVYSEAEADAARTAGRTLYANTFTTTKGPVGLSVSVTPSPVVLYGENTFTLNIKISNLASGTIYNGGATYAGTGSNVNIPSTNLNKVDLRVTSSSGLSPSFDCNGEQELVEGKDTTVICTVTVPSSFSNFQSYNLNVVASYGYFTERTATITVQGRSSSGTGTGTTSTPTPTPTPSSSPTVCTTDLNCPAIDTDGGNVIGTQGTCSWRACTGSGNCIITSTQTDSCTNNLLTEWYPSQTNSNFCAAVVITCPTGQTCTNGACN
jgi:hypothetical protein